MDSTKSGGAVYVVASSMIVIALAAIILRFQGVVVELTVEGLIVLVPIIGGLSLLFMSIKLERLVIENITLYRINRKKKKDDIRIQMAAALLFIAPWESAPKEAYTIEESLDFDLKRMLRSREFNEQISELQQVFWILFLLPFTLIDVILIYSMDWLLIVGILGLGILSAFLILYRNNAILNRILSYAYGSWFLEGTFADLERRNAGVRLGSTHEDRLKASLELTKPIIDLAIKGDWEGFDRKSRNLEDLVGIPGYDTLKRGIVERYMIFLEWCTQHIHDIHASHVDIFLKNGLKQMSSSISILKKFREDSFSIEEEMVSKLLKILTNSSKDKDTFIGLNVEFYESLDKESLKHLNPGYLDKIGGLPFLLQKKGIPSIKSEITGIDRVSWLITIAAEQEVLDIQRTLSVVAAWETEPTTILGAMGSRAKKTILENDVGFTIEQLTTIARNLGQWLLTAPNPIDPYRVLKHLEHQKKNNQRTLMKKYALALQVDTIRSPTEEINTGLEAVTRFIDDFDKT